MDNSEARKVLRKWERDLGGIVYDLEEFLNEIKRFKSLLITIRNKQRPTNKEFDEADSLREKLLSKATIIKLIKIF